MHPQKPKEAPPTDAAKGQERGELGGRLHVSTAHAYNPALCQADDVRADEDGRGRLRACDHHVHDCSSALRGGRVLGEGAGGGVDQDHRAEDDVPAHRRRSEDHEGRAETSQTSRRRVRAQTILCGGVCATQLGSDLTTYMLEMARTTTTTQQECNCHCFPCLLSGAPFGDMHSRLPSPRSALRDSDLLFSGGAYCFWFVPLLRMFRGTAGRRRACACARDTDEASTRAHTAHRPTRSTLRETRGARHTSKQSRTTRRESVRVGAKEGKVWTSRSVQLVQSAEHEAH